MKRLLSCSATIALIGLHACGREAKNESRTEAMDFAAAQSTIRSYEASFELALKARDSSALDKMIADAFRLVNPDGQVIDKRRMIRNDLLPDRVSFQTFDRHIEQIHSDANTIVALGYFSNKGSINGIDVSGSYRFSNLYVKNGGGWKLASTQLTRIKE